MSTLDISDVGQDFTFAALISWVAEVDAGVLVMTEEQHQRFYQFLQGKVPKRPTRQSVVSWHGTEVVVL